MAAINRTRPSLAQVQPKRRHTIDAFTSHSLRSDAKRLRARAGAPTEPAARGRLIGSWPARRRLRLPSGCPRQGNYEGKS
jgi:hypothetical protein